MLIGADYQYVVTLSRPDGGAVVQRRITVDWDPALEWTRFEALRRSQSSQTITGETHIEPIWSDSGPPEVDGFRVGLRGGSEPFSVDFPRLYFDAPAKALGTECVKAGDLEADETVQYEVSAFASYSGSSPHASDSMDVEEVQTLPPILETEESSPEPDFTGKTQLGSFDPSDFRVIVPEWILEEVRTRTKSSPGSETGGFLLGHLCRNGAGSDLYVNVSAQLDAAHTLSELTRLKFTPETWTDLRERLKLRKRDELLLGWWHSHPVRDWNCKACPEERQRVCPLASDFFSEHDRALHRAVFPSAFAVGMVANDVAFSEVTFSMFGWRRGLLEARGFHLTEKSSEGSSLVPVTTDGGSDGH